MKETEQREFIEQTVDTAVRLELQEILRASRSGAPVQDERVSAEVL